MQTILLTGGSGFIGRNIIEQLGATYTILAPSHHELELTDTKAVESYLKQHAVDLVIHSANRGGSRADATQAGVAASNLRIFYNIIQAKQYYKRLIVLGSGAEYDKCLPLKQISEIFFGTSIPADEYGLYKYVCARYAEQVDYITHLRLFAVFGKYEDYRIRFISNAICKALLDLPITIKQNVVFDYVYVDDVVSLLDLIIANPTSEKIINVGSGMPVDLKTIAEKILTILDKKLPIVVGKSGLGNEYSADIGLLKKTYPNAKVTSLDVALQSLIDYYRPIAETLDTEAFLADI